MFVPLYAEPGPSAPARAPIVNRALAVLVVAASLLSLPGLGGAVERAVDDALRTGGVERLLAGAPVHLSFGSVLDRLVLQRGPGLRASQLVGTAFVHGGLGHLFANVVLLLVLGGPVERRLGPWRFLALWLGSAAAGSLAWLACGEGLYAVGASGVVMGLGAACALVDPEARVGVLAHPLSLLMAVGGLLGLAVGDVVGACAGMLLASAPWVVTTVRAWAGGAEAPPEGHLARVLGFRVFRPGIASFVGACVVLDLVPLLARHGTGVLATVLRLADGVAHEAHLGGAAAGALGAWYLGALGLVDAAAPARARRPFPVAHRPALAPARRAVAALHFEAWRADRDGARPPRRAPPPLPTRARPLAA